MKLIFGIALVLGLLMLREGVVLGVMIALLIAFAVWLAQPLAQTVKALALLRNRQSQLLPVAADLDKASV